MATRWRHAEGEATADRPPGEWAATTIRTARSAGASGHDRRRLLGTEVTKAWPQRPRSAAPDPARLSLDKPIYTISVAAEILAVHPRTLMMYEHLGLVVPHRTPDEPAPLLPA